MKTLLIFSSEYCGHCTRVLDIVKDLDIPHKVVKIEESPNYWTETMSVWDVRTVPQIFVLSPFDESTDDDCHIGGAEDFYPLITSGDIWKLLKEEKKND